MNPKIVNPEEACSCNRLINYRACSAPNQRNDEDHISEVYWKRKSNPRSAVHVLSGFNCSLRVRNDDLVTFDTGEERSFPKVTHGLQAIVFLGEGGSITIDAVKWCEAQGIAISILDWHGELVSVTQPSASTDRFLSQLAPQATPYVALENTVPIKMRSVTERVV